MSGCGHVAISLRRSTGFSLDAEFDVPASGVTVLFGPSGCGKTTVLRSIAGLERAQGFVQIAGHVWQDDARRVFEPTHRRRLGYVFQEASLFEHMNVRRNLEYGLKRFKDADGRKRLTQAVELLGISQLLDRSPAQLSGGERQRCAIARSLCVRPSALLLDEPLAALDQARRREIMPWLEQLRRELSIPILYVTHSEEELMRLGDQLVLMRNGSVAAAGPVQEVLSQSGFGSSFGHDVPMLLNGCVREIDSEWKLAAVACAGSMVWVAASAMNVGERVRLSVRASDVTLSLARPQGLSAQNAIPCRVAEIFESQSGPQRLVRLDCSGEPLLALVTSKAIHDLGVRKGMDLWALVKAVSVLG
jgi:molybdate transport system ATP-binding protein